MLCKATSKLEKFSGLFDIYKNRKNLYKSEYEEQ